EIIALFEEWWDLSSKKDIERTMAPIADEIVSFEHIAPLEYEGKKAVRAVCQQGFDAMRGELRWDMPKLHVVVRGDMAITWGLNRMVAQEPGAPRVELWSRGTRIFQ